MPESPAPGMGNSTLRDLCERYGLDLNAVRSDLTRAGLAVEDGMSIKKIASINGVSPVEIYSRIRLAGL